MTQRNAEELSVLHPAQGEAIKILILHMCEQFLEVGTIFLTISYESNQTIWITHKARPGFAHPPCRDEHVVSCSVQMQFVNKSMGAVELQLIMSTMHMT